MRRLTRLTQERPPLPRILIVDDDRLVLASLAQGLRRMGYEVSAVSTADECLVIVCAGNVDLVILDIRLVEADGIEVARQIQGVMDLPIIFLSAFHDGEIVDKALQAGGFTYMVKPISVDQMVPVIEATMARSRDLSMLRMQEDRLKAAIESDRCISTAVGVIMERSRVESKEAFEILRARARRLQRKVSDVAAELIAASDSINSVSGTQQKLPANGLPGTK